jgi:hypothetical protein
MVSWCTDSGFAFATKGMRVFPKQLIQNRLKERASSTPFGRPLPFQINALRTEFALMKHLLHCLLGWNRKAQQNRQTDRKDQR